LSRIYIVQNYIEAKRSVDVILYGITMPIVYREFSNIVLYKANLRLKVSIIIPTVNEKKRIGKLIDHLLSNADDSLSELIVADGGSTDGTKAIVQSKGAKLLEIAQKGRAVQMNTAANQAKGDVLKSGHLAGSYRFKFDSNRLLLGINAFFTRFSALFCRGGDQSMFISKQLFNEMGQFDESYVIMEDFDFIRRFNKRSAFHVIQKDILVSDRKYENNSYLRVQIANLFAFTMFRRGFCQHKIKALYERMLDLSYD